MAEEKIENVNEDIISQEIEEDEEMLDAAGVQSRGEKKARKALVKLGLKRLPGINRVTIRRARNVLFVVARPDVYKSANSDTYIVFGEAKVEDMGAQAAAMQAQAQAAAQAASAQNDGEAPTLTEGDLAEAAAASKPEEEEDDDEEVDEDGVESKDIELVMAQANVKRSKAVKALKASNNDIVNAIMELTM
ncbi:NAC domain-containing protein [Piptocephalis cylindrospora]|uniref:Nascent polypeptide-associated complex subunit alpha n=1 Tax=Piptocephalis cylindrospora TaxID=1907219 RepID=A0A4P9Y715_9FUNG|nr:NAC domain-containing protein [Piptocephalis cylindrospora]|eukprot:RKP14612.1 NAC domain-containing protein [Piptocephalis cylindrospora]